MADLVLPILIALGCVAVIAAVHVLTRRRPSRAELAMPGQDSPTAVSPSGRQPVEPPDVAPTPLPALARWHVRHEAAVLDFIESVDATLDGSDDADPSAFAAVLADAAAAHPATEMRSELAGLRSSSSALLDAIDRGDDGATARHRERYRSYRRDWLERCAQFPVDRRRIADAQARELDREG